MENLMELSFVGPLHNQILQNITQLGNFPNFTSHESYIVAKRDIEFYYSNNDLGSPQVLDFEEFERQLNIILAQGNDLTSLFIDLESNGLINQIQLDYLLMINDLYVNANDPNKLADNLFQLEQEVSNLETLNLNEKSLIVGTSIIGRNSAYYWSYSFSEPNNPWNSQINQLAAGPKWWVRGLRDLGGFCVGFGVGTIISVGNPVVGAACGTCVAAGCSAAS
jgi:hypothetical protein